MVRWREAVVVSVRRRRPGQSDLTVRVPGPGDGPTSAVAYHDLVGEPVPGDRVLLNVNALERGLGTGGDAMVVALPDRLPQDPPASPGHLVKARYTPLQTMVLGVDEQESEHHPVLEDADDLAGLPVVVCDLHSSLPAVIAGVRAVRPQAVVAYVMTDGGALPAVYSRTVAGLRDAGWLAGCITVGQAFGGDLDAVTVHSGLLAAHHVLGADVAVVTQGPGNLGTGTRWGFSGVAAGEALNAAGVLGGHGVATLRMSGADPRPRHRGVSHHSLTAYGRVLRVPADVVVPDTTGILDVDGAPVAALVREQVGRLLADAPWLVRVDEPAGGLAEALDAAPVALRTMGRAPQDDPVAFLAAAAAGRHAARLASIRT